MPRSMPAPLLLLFAALFLAIPCPGAGASPENPSRPRCYDGEGRTISCPDSGQDAALLAGVAWPAPRFTDNGDGTITDHLTGLVWLQDAGCLGKAGWQGAQEQVKAFSGSEAAECANYSAAHGDWRLPTIQELEALTNLAEPDMAAWLQTMGFIDVAPAGYWTSTPTANPYNGWLVQLDSGAVTYEQKMTPRHIWPVRAAGTPKKTTPAEPPDTAQEQKGSAARFVDHRDGTITDTRTGLMWLKDAGRLAPAAWSEALAAVQGLNSGLPQLRTKYQDWRLPNRRELQSLIAYQHDYPALPPESPFGGVRSAYYWSSSTLTAAPVRAWGVHLTYGDSAPLIKAEPAAVWPVRTTTAGSNLARTGDWLQEQRLFAQQEESSEAEEAEAGPPRFVDNGDGTLTDTRTGLMWLADAGCFGKMNRQAAEEMVIFFNNNLNPLECRGYTGNYQDWRLPTIEQLAGLPQPATSDGAAWLVDQGFSRVQPHGYWSETGHKLNIYYGWLYNLKSGQKRSYPTTFRYFVWPCRSGLAAQAAQEGK